MPKIENRTIDSIEQTQAGVIARIRTLYTQLTKKEQLVADYILSDEDVIYRSITEVVKRSGVGYGSVMRFCKRLGFLGFQDLKIRLTTDLALRTAYQDKKGAADDPIAALRERAFEDIRNTAQLLSPDSLRKAARMLLDAESVLIVGFGGSAITAAEVEFRLTRFGIRAIAVPDSQLQRIRVVCLSSRDVLFMVSFSGSTKDIIWAGKTARKAGVKTICLTNFAESPVSELADVRLVTAIRIDPLSAEVASRVPMAFVLDALFTEMVRLDRRVEKVLEETFNSTADTFL